MLEVAAQADAWLVTSPPGSDPGQPERAIFIELAVELARYNSGLSGPGHCTDTAPQKPGERALQRESSCMQPPAYWRSTLANWPLSELQIGEQVYNQEQLLALLEYRGDEPNPALQRELVAARLSQAAGADLGDWGTFLELADLWLGGGSDQPTTLLR